MGKQNATMTVGKTALYIPEICRKRLLQYAADYQELAEQYSDTPELADGTEGKDLREESTNIRYAMYERRMQECRQTMRNHLYDMSRIMENVAGRVLDCVPVEARLQRRLARAMKEEGILISGPCYVQGNDGCEKLLINMRTEKKRQRPSDEVADLISVILNRRMVLSAGSPMVVDSVYNCFFLEEEPELVAMTGFAKAVKEGEVMSGDNYLVRDDTVGHRTIMLSDGTGSGVRAAADSAEILNLMDQFLEAGYDMEGAIRMVNAAVYAKGRDNNHPTLDVCEVDLHKGECEIRKIGGAVTIWKNGADVDALDSAGNLPLGIFQEVCPEVLRHSLHHDDYLIMLSDGVTEAFDTDGSSRNIFETVSRIKERNPREIAEKILRLAIVAAGGKVKDDMTVGVIGIWEG